MKGERVPDDVVIMEMFSERYGWTINEIREQPVDVILQYLEILSVKGKLEKEAHKKK